MTASGRAPLLPQCHLQQTKELQQLVWLFECFDMLKACLGMEDGEGSGLVHLSITAAEVVTDATAE